ncbi:MAG: hypothetical protein HOQ07_05230, partial [Sinomonas sp.]|nr:hypothetical protein [Sinomonas sp.]
MGERAGVHSVRPTNGGGANVPRSDDIGLLRRLAADVLAIDYTVDGVAGLVGPAAHEALSRDQIVPALVATER